MHVPYFVKRIITDAVKLMCACRMTFTPKHVEYFCVYDYPLLLYFAKLHKLQLLNGDLRLNKCSIDIDM